MRRYLSFFFLQYWDRYWDGGDQIFDDNDNSDNNENDNSDSEADSDSEEDQPQFG